MRVAAAGLGAITTMLLLSGCADEQLDPVPTPDAVPPPTSCQDVLRRHPTEAERIAVGRRTACVVNNRGGMYCWGDNALGAAGQPELVGDTCQPWKAGWHECLRTVGLGGTHGCGLTYDGRALCWGQNNYGQLGVPSAAGGPSSVEVVLPSPVVQVAAGGAQGAALLSDGKVLLWGTYPSLADDLAEPAWPFPDLLAIKALPQSGPPFGAVTVDGRALCWASRCGDGASAPKDAPVEVPGLERVADIRFGGLTCALVDDGRVYCWGTWPVGDGTSEQVLSPVEVAGIDSAVQLSADRHVCITLAGGKVMCWGDNLSGQCAQPPSFAVLEPTVVEDLPPAIQVEVGSAFTCALTIERDVYCWGDNSSCELGIGDPGGDYPEPQKVKLPTWW